MGKAAKILRKSLHAFLKNCNSAAGLLVLPFSAAALLSQSFNSSSTIHSTISLRLRLLFEASGFPASSQFFSLLNSKLSQAIFSFISTFPFTLTFLVLAKASIIQTLHRLPPSSCGLHLYLSLVQTHLFNSLTILSANAAAFSLLFFAFNVVEALHVASYCSILVISAAGVILYSLLLTNATAACNLATVVTATEDRRGWLAVLRALVLVRGQAATAISVTLPANLGTSAVEALFQFRVVRPCMISGTVSLPAFCEGLLIAYIYSILIVVDTIIACMVYKSCRSSESHWGPDDDLLRLEEKVDL